MPLVVKLVQGRTERVVRLEVQVVHFGLVGRVAALFADIHFGPALFVGVLVLDAVDLERVRLERAALRERLVAPVARVRADTSVRSCVALEVESVVEALCAEGAQISLDVTVALEVAIEESLEGKCLAAFPT